MPQPRILSHLVFLALLLFNACGDGDAEIQTGADSAEQQNDAQQVPSETSNDRHGRVEPRSGEECGSGSISYSAATTGAVDPETAFREGLKKHVARHPRVPDDLPASERSDGYWRADEQLFAFNREGRTIADFSVQQVADGTWVLDSLTICGPAQQEFGS